MKYCPLMSFGKQYSGPQPCFKEDCGFADFETGECLIHKFLLQMTNEHEPLTSHDKNSYIQWGDQ